MVGFSYYLIFTENVTTAFECDVVASEHLNPKPPPPLDHRPCNLKASTLALPPLTPHPAQPEP